MKQYWALWVIPSAILFLSRSLGLRTNFLGLFQQRSFVCKTLLGGSWVVVSRVIGRVTILLTASPI